MRMLPKINKILLFMAMVVFVAPALAQDLPTLQDLQHAKVSSVNANESFDQKPDFALQIRREAQREAARSYGARGGLAWRTRAVGQTLKQNATALSKTYDFRLLLITAPSNLLIEPPIISEALDAFNVSDAGDEAAVSDVIYNISRQARIVSTPRNWRQYLERDFDTEITPPPNILLPETAEERRLWSGWVAEGWEEGAKQADEIFQSDLNRLIADFEGMIRYRMLLAEGKVSSPYAVHEDRGVTGGGDEMRIGDRAIRISGPAQLRAAGDTWNPASR